jgi:putative nucleotidyltransferase with HDIG domain
VEYLPIRVSTLRGDSQINFDAFVKINEKFVLYVRKGDSFEGERLDRLKSKKLKKMFISLDEETKYRDYLSKNIEMAYDKNSGKSLQNRAEIIQGQQQSNAEDVMENPENEKSYNSAKDAAGRFVNLLLNEPEALERLSKMENMDQNIAHHGVTVSTLAVGLAKRLGFTDPKVNQMITMGSLLHDLDHFQTQLNVARKLTDFSADDMTTYKNHPMAAARKVQDKKHFDQQVINIILQHEETIDGQGFPQKLPEAKLDPTSIIVGLCNCFDRMVTFEKLPRADATKKLTIENVGKYPLGHIQQLSGLLNSMK